MEKAIGVPFCFFSRLSRPQLKNIGRHAFPDRSRIAISGVKPLAVAQTFWYCLFLQYLDNEI